MLNNRGLFLISCITAVILLPKASSRGDFEDLSTSQLEDLLKTLEYEEEYRNDVEPNEYRPEPDYLNDEHAWIPQDMMEDEQEEDLTGFSPPQIRQTETLQHGTPITSGGIARPHLSAGGPIKAQLPRGGPVLPAYCDPPNPCPPGYTDKDGCIEDFENSSEFSRKYQARQNCLCDSEHMFNCPMEDNEPKSADEPFMSGFPELEGNPFLAGNRLPIAAKKGFGF